MRSAARALAAILALVLVVAACDGGGGDDAAFVTYERVWPDGFTETTEIFDDGRVAMVHGETLERLTISSADVDAIRAALEEPIEQDAADASPVRTITLADGTVIERPRPDPRGPVELLDRLTSTHTIDTPVTDVEPVVVEATPPADD